MTRGTTLIYEITAEKEKRLTKGFNGNDTETEIINKIKDLDDIYGAEFLYANKEEQTILFEKLGKKLGFDSKIAKFEFGGIVQDDLIISLSVNNHKTVKKIIVTETGSKDIEGWKISLLSENGNIINKKKNEVIHSNSDVKFYLSKFDFQNEK